jgi:8-amino-7-oxononanoate synthase
MAPTKQSNFISAWAKSQQPKAANMKGVSVFYRNLEEELDVNRAQYVCSMLHVPNATSDFASCDILSFGTSGALRKGFLEELANNPNFQLGSHGSRLVDGNSEYMEKLEQDVADYHGAEAALIVNSGGLANESIFETIPRPGDAIVYDELIHASVHEGLKHSLCLCKKSFKHNNVDSFIDTLIEVRDSQTQIRNGKRSVLVSVEGFYSMDGDVCPLRELIEAAKEIFPSGNVQFIIDEAHSSGIIGPNGGGLVNALGLEKEVAVRMHTFGKALAGSGGKNHQPLP